MVDLNPTPIQEAAGNEDAIEMVQSIIRDYATIIEEVKQGMAISEEARDQTTGDMLLAIHSELEKHVWMLRAFLLKSS